MYLELQLIGGLEMMVDTTSNINNIVNIHTVQCEVTREMLLATSVAMNIRCVQKYAFGFTVDAR